MSDGLFPGKLVQALKIIAMAQRQCLSNTSRVLRINLFQHLASSRQTSAVKMEYLRKNLIHAQRD